MKLTSAFWGKLALLALIAYWSHPLFFSEQPWIFLDNFNLLIHEAGHIIFIPFGEFFTVLGGSLTQILVPLIFLIGFYLQKQVTGCYFSLFWLGDNLINVSYYVGDASAQSLPLIADGLTHDWNWILSTTNLLKYDHYFASLIFLLGACCLLGSIILLILDIRDDIIGK